MGCWQTTSFQKQDLGFEITTQSLQQLNADPARTESAPPLLALLLEGERARAWCTPPLALFLEAARAPLAVGSRRIQGVPALGPVGELLGTGARARARDRAAGCTPPPWPCSWRADDQLVLHILCLCNHAFGSRRRYPAVLTSEIFTTRAVTFLPFATFVTGVRGLHELALAGLVGATRVVPYLRGEGSSPSLFAAQPVEGTSAKA